MTSMMEQRSLAVLTLALIVPFLTELLSGNTPLATFIDPMVFGYFVVMYGFPALLIREAWIRWRIGMVPLFALGIAYAILNEGVAARTLLLTDHEMFMEPLRGFDTFGLNLPWASLILPWHALYSVLYPIMIVTVLYPKASRQRWLSNGAVLVLSLTVFAIGSLSYFGDALYVSKSPWYLLLFWAIIAAVASSVRKFASNSATYATREGAGSQRSLLAFGACLIVVFIAPLALAKTGLPGIIQVALTTLLILSLYRYYVRRHALSPTSLAFVAIGHYLLGTIMTALVLGPRASLGLVPVWAIILALFVLLRKRTADPDVSGKPSIS